jgi:hypothetical protein
MKVCDHDAVTLETTNNVWYRPSWDLPHGAQNVRGTFHFRQGRGWRCWGLNVVGGQAQMPVKNPNEIRQDLRMSGRPLSIPRRQPAQAAEIRFGWLVFAVVRREEPTWDRQGLTETVKRG